MTAAPPLVLASASPRRAAILDELGVRFTVRTTDVDETPRPDEDPHGYVRRLAIAKATRANTPGAVTLAADTIVVLDGALLGKPSDPDDARKTLRHLSGRAHLVLTGVAVAAPGGRLTAAVATTSVSFREITDDEIDWYVGTGEPLDKAGAYGIQGLGALFVATIDGSYHNVVGLPVHTVDACLIDLGFTLRTWMA